jgi:hypothetical protein
LVDVNDPAVQSYGLSIADEKVITGSAARGEQALA